MTPLSANDALPRSPSTATMLLSEAPEAPFSVRGFFGTGGTASPIRSLFGADDIANAPSSAPLGTFFDKVFRTALRTSSAPGFFIPTMSKAMVTDQTHTN